MKAGRLKYSLIVYRPTTTESAYGAETATQWEELYTIHAERVKHTGARHEEVGEHFPDTTTEWNVRKAHTIEENWRVKQVGGYLYDVVAITPNLDRGYNVLKCTRVNE